MSKSLLIFAGLFCLTIGSPVLISSNDLEDKRVFYRIPVLPQDMYSVEMTDLMDGQTDGRGVKEILTRHRRSPQQLGVQGMAYPGGAGSVRAQFDSPQWTSPNGRHSLEGNAYYQRNFNMPGPRQDWGAQATYTFRF